MVRQSMPVSERITFEEFAILCHLQVEGVALKASEIADYQAVLRTTMTHRSNLLARNGYIERTMGENDRRNVFCTLTDKGRDYISLVSNEMLAQIKPSQPLHRTRPERIVMFVDAMGHLFCTARDIVLLCLLLHEEGSSISLIVDESGLLQPTVSMSVGGLIEDELVKRVSGQARTTWISLSGAGREAAEEIAQQISELVVHRMRNA